MSTDSIARLLTYLLLAAGCALAFVAALVPHFDAGYYLSVSVLLTGLLPYLVYAMVLPYARGWRLALPALLIVALHGWAVASERFIDYRGYSDGTIYYVPLALAFLALLLLAWELRTHPPGRD
jgi:hypothetical protein